MRTSMSGLKKWMDAHPRKSLRGYFSINGRDMTRAMKLKPIFQVKNLLYC